jgi:predicted permease
MGTLFRRLRYWLRQREFDDALREEIEFHRGLTQQVLENGGLSTEESRLAARRDLGNVTRAREESRAIWIWPWLDSVWQDTTYATRSLRRHPGFTLLAVVILGVAIGLNTSLFTVFAGLALRPMAGLTEPSRVVSVSGEFALGRSGVIGMSFPEFQFLATESRSFSGLVAERNTSVTVEAGGVGRTLSAHVVTGSYFDVLGVRMEHGRGFLPAEDRRGSSVPVVVLSFSLWQGLFGADPEIVGAPIRINDIPHAVVGITSREFNGSEGGMRRLWLPLSSLPTLRSNDPFESTLLDRPQDCCVNVLGRLRDGVTSGQAEAELQVLSDRFRAGVGQEARAIVLGGTEFLKGQRAAASVLAVMGVLFVGIVLVLLMACANVGNLLLARAAGRAGEIGVRLSLGAGRPRIVRQLLTEGFVLALIGTGVGVAIAHWLPSLVLNDVAGQPAPFEIATDGWVLGYAIVLAAVACAAFALAPALHATRGDVAMVIKSGALPSRRFPLRGVLLGVQVAVTVVLLTSAGLLLRGVATARGVDPGFAVEGVVVATVELPPVSDSTRAQRFSADLVASLRDAGVEAFALVSNEPLGDSSSTTSMRLPGEAEEQMRTIEFLDVTPGYFDVLRIPIAAGRGFADADAGRGVAVVNESMARRYWPDDNPVGRSFFAGGTRRSLEVVGVVKDAHLDSLDVVEPLFFQPMTAAGVDVAKVLFESRRASTSAAVTAAIQGLERRARIDFTPLTDRLADRRGELRFAPLAASILGTFGLTLATVGMFGTFAYAVCQRTREIGLRMALGARAADIVRLVLTGSSRAVAIGLAVGMLGALGASQVLRRSLYGVSPLDPLALGGVALMLAVAALAASYVPARRALRIDPSRALRWE